MKKTFNFLTAVLLTLVSVPFAAHAASGTEGASFLEIPVGAEPVAFGGAYSALAANAYAPTWNPGGLAYLESPQLAAQHLAYVESIRYEYASFVRPIRPGRAFGATVQYLGTGDITETDATGNNVGSFSTHYGAYGLSYGHALTPKLSLGVTGKFVEARLESERAQAMAADVGGMYQVSDKLMMAAVVTNFGTKMKFINEADSLPLAFHLGGAYQFSPQFLLALEGIYRQTGLASAHIGGEWRPVPILALRAGYRTDTAKELSPLAGLTVGMEIRVLSQTSISYAFAPLDQLGNTQYFSVLMRFTGAKGK